MAGWMEKQSRIEIESKRQKKDLGNELDGMLKKLLSWRGSKLIVMLDTFALYLQIGPIK